MSIKRICLCLALGLAVSAPAQASSISLAVIGSVSQGSSFDVAVQATDVFTGRAADDALLAYGFNVSVGNGSALQYVGESAGPLFDDFSAAFGGTPMVAGIATNILINPGDFVEPLTLATLHFNASGPGSSTIDVTWDATDPNQGLVYLDLPYGAISASTDVSVAAVPEPVTLVTFASGLTALFTARRRHLRK